MKFHLKSLRPHWGLVSVFFMSVLVLSQVNCTPPPPDWPMFRHDPQHTGRSPFPIHPSGSNVDWWSERFGEWTFHTISIPTTVSLKWKYPPNGEAACAPFISSPAIGRDGTIYVSSCNATEGKLYAINSYGNLKWTEPLDINNKLNVDQLCNEVWGSSPAIGPDGTIYIGSNDGNVYAVVDKGTYGYKKWTCQIGGQCEDDLCWCCKLLGCDCTNLGDLSCYKKCVFSSPVISTDNSTIYIGSDNGTLCAIPTNDPKNVDIKEIQPKWTSPLPSLQSQEGRGGVVISSPAIDNDGIIWVGAQGEIAPSYDNFYGVLCGIADNSTYGDVIFQRGGEEINNQQWYETSVASSPAIGTDGTVYYCTYGRIPVSPTCNGTVYAFNHNRTDGTGNWHVAVEGCIMSSPAIGPDGTIYVGSFNFNGTEGKLWAFNLNGESITNFPVKLEKIISSPAIDGTGVIYIGACFGDNIPGPHIEAQPKFGCLHAIRPDGTVLWTYPLTYGEWGAIVSSPAIDSDGTIYVSSIDGHVYAVTYIPEQSILEPLAEPPKFEIPWVVGLVTLVILGAIGSILWVRLRKRSAK